MRIETLPDEFIQAQPIIDTIEAAGYEAYYVGGSVRDTLLGLPIHDVDIATSAYPEEVKALFKRTVDTGIEHGTVMILDHGQGYETTTFRTESGYQDYRRPDSVQFVRSLKEDLNRRDFTINALALKTDGTIIDYFDGLNDLKAKRIKAVGNPETRFNEDALRMMRAVRFASQLDFTIDPETIDGITHHGQLLTKIAVERIHVEFVKLLLGQWPSRGLDVFLSTGLYQYCPDFADYEAPLIELAKQLKVGMSNETAVWALLATTFKLNTNQVASLLKHWKSANQMITDTQVVVRAIQAITTNQVNAWCLYQTGRERLAIANEVATALSLSEITTKELQARYDQLPIQSKRALSISGQDLMQAGVQPGPGLGRGLTYLEHQVVNGLLTNQTEVLIKAAIHYLNEEA
ncbi:tRNA nucleotidyltransferase poly(A) polymerase [Secundilactobacillus odoratitofui DSM 19909 = JCM 15043]|uniref:CCA-adding enzyme n=1 Tax=Secundilactobacillus odoratitofui DSM 19909 = JCM 15043 TaxID=1423776 RepID=A0A0R1LQI0_9LACO|nr:CCA tRNA nucleotidyltransferase [Secundilactobacillus odoratitofui]KRK98108.1 tRNA nucleotidyltransferase poly(A) polymerase [Secundilactobacillus odoratitofui DSM 19909 = JCM 15043]